MRGRWCFKSDKKNIKIEAISVRLKISNIHIMKIFDTFLFFNELDILEIRLNILYPHIDYFVINESVETFSGDSKPLYYFENRKKNCIRLNFTRLITFFFYYSHAYIHGDLCLYFELTI